MNDIDQYLFTAIPGADASDQDIKVLRRVPEHFRRRFSKASRKFSAMIVDLETMGLNPLTDPIIELGLVKFSFSSDDGIIEVLDTYNSFNDPGSPIPEKITQLTGITTDDVKDQEIDWAYIAELSEDCELIICHNAIFDRRFLELQTPETIQRLFENQRFACTLNDINWDERSFECRKLKCLNADLGFFYDGHRALNDCWATFNLLISANGAFDELIVNLKKNDVLLYALNAPYDKKDMLKSKGYKWSDGLESTPKSWYATIPQDDLDTERAFLDEVVYCKEGAAQGLPFCIVNSRSRYSARAGVLKA